MEDIKVTEGTILESLNNKADIDGGNYKGSGLQAVLEETTLSTAGGTMTGNLTINKSRPFIYFDNPTVDATLTPSAWTGLGSIYMRDMNNAISGYIENSLNTSSSTTLTIGARKVIDNTNYSSVIYLTVDASGKSSFEFPRCTTKATTTSSAKNNSVAVVVQNYKSGTSWYRVWSDGWIEQGGASAFTSSASTGTVTFAKKFTSTPTINISGTFSTIAEIEVSALTTSNFTWILNTARTGTIYYYACGY